MKSILLAICAETGYTIAKNNSGIELSDIVDGAMSGNIVSFIRGKTGCAKATVTSVLKRTFPDRDPIKDSSIVKFLLAKRGLRKCPKCSTIKEKLDFYTNISKSDGLADHCKDCSKLARISSYNKDPQKEICANKVRRINRDTIQTPSWANLDAITEFYRNRPEGFHVDHIIPLNGVAVCGLHVENNLQYLSEKDNLSKNNKYVATII